MANSVGRTNPRERGSSVFCVIGWVIAPEAVVPESMLRIAGKGHHPLRLCDLAALILLMRSSYVQSGGSFSRAFTRSDHSSQVKERVERRGPTLLVMRRGMSPTGKVQIFFARMASVQTHVIFIIIFPSSLLSDRRVPQNIFMGEAFTLETERAAEVSKLHVEDFIPSVSTVESGPSIYVPPNQSGVFDA